MNPVIPTPQGAASKSAQVPVQTLYDLVKVLAGTLEAHSPRLGIHSRRVGETARKLGEHLGLDGQTLQNVEFAAWLHEIGKTCRPVQNNPLASTIPAGQSLLCYPEIGFNLLNQIAGFEGVATGVCFQNEHYDGTGSPKGLSGESIPLAARVIAIVNAYDEAVFPAMNPAVVLRAPGMAALTQGSGKRFDPQIVSVMQKHLAQITASSGQDTEIEISVRQLLDGMTLSRDIKIPNSGTPLPQGTRLTGEIISRLQSLALVNPAFASLFICCSQHSIAETQSSRKTSQKRPTVGAGNSEPAAPPTETLPEGNSTEKARRCLIVDDSHFIRTALCREMQRAGFETADTGDGRVALAWLEQSSYTLALVDLDMPSIRGADLIAHMLNYVPDMPCIVVTGRPNKEDLLRLSKMPNFSGLVIKPWSSEKLLDAVSLAVAKRTQPASCSA